MPVALPYVHGRVLSEVEVVAFSVPTSTGNVDITGSFPWIPAGALFMVSGGVTLGTQRTEFANSLGACDGTNQWALANHDDSGAGTTEARHKWHDDACVLLIDNNSNEVTQRIVQAAFSAFIAGGVTLNFSRVDGNAYLGVAVFFNRAWSTKCGIVKPSETLDATVNVTGIGFQPKGVVFASTNDGGDTPGGNANNTAGTSCVYGFWDGTTQATVVSSSSDGLSAAAAIGVIVHTDRVGARTNGAGVGGNPEYEASNMNSDGFDLTTRNVAGARPLMYFAFAAPDAAVSVGVQTTRTSTGTQDVTHGFMPSAVIGAACMANVADAVESNDDASGVSMFAFSGAVERCVVNTARDNVDNHPTDSTMEALALACYTNEGTRETYKATLDSMLSNGYRLNFTTASVDGAARYFIDMAIGRV